MRALCKLKAIEVKNAAYQGKTLKLSDGGGLLLLVNEHGRYWRYRYRHAGKQKELALGRYPEVSLAEARTRHGEARKLVEQGIDPVKHRQARREATEQAATNTFEVIAREWWQDVHQHAVTASHAGRNLRRLELHAFPQLGRQPISEITPPELLKTLRHIEASGSIETAHRVKTLCSQVFRFAIATGRGERDPAQDLQGLLKPTQTRHHPAITDPKEIGQLLRTLDCYQGHPVTRYALQLAPLVFVRPFELRTMRWAALDLETGEWEYTPSKNGQPMITPLPRQALSILREIECLTGRGTYVFPGARDQNRPMSENTVRAALVRLGYIDQMSGHGFRATARTLLVERLDYPIEVVEMQLAHAVRDPNGRAYNRTTYLAQRREMLQRWADYLDELRSDAGHP